MALIVKSSFHSIERSSVSMRKIQEGMSINPQNIEDEERPCKFIQSHIQSPFQPENALLQRTNTEKGRKSSLNHKWHFHNISSSIMLMPGAPQLGLAFGIIGLLALSGGWTG